MKIQYEKDYLNGKVIKSGNFVSKSFDMRKEPRAIDNEIKARKLYRDLTVDLTAYWKKSTYGILCIVKKKISTTAIGSFGNYSFGTALIKNC